MVVRSKDIIEAIASHVGASGRFRGGVFIGEPLAPTSGLTASVFNTSTSYAVDQPLSKSAERRTYTVRISGHGANPRANIEFDLDDAVTETLENILGDLDLGSVTGVRGVDVSEIEVDWDWEPAGDGRGKGLRIADIRIPVIVDGSSTFAR